MKFIFLFLFGFTINQSHSQSALNAMPAKKQIEIDSIVSLIELSNSMLEKSSLEGEDSILGNYTAEILWLQKGDILRKANIYFQNSNKGLLFYYWRSEAIVVFDETEKLYVFLNNLYNINASLIDPERQNKILNFNTGFIKILMTLLKD